MHGPRACAPIAGRLRFVWTVWLILNADHRRRAGRRRNDDRAWALWTGLISYLDFGAFCSASNGWCVPTVDESRFSMIAGPLASLLLDEDAADRPLPSARAPSSAFIGFAATSSALSARAIAAGCRRGLVVADDAYWATVGFFALAHAGAETLLPSNMLPSTLATLEGHYDHVVAAHDVDGVAGPRLDLSPGEEAISPLPPLDAGQARIVLFTSGSTGTPKRIVKTVRQLEVEALTVERVLGQQVPGDAAVHANRSATSISTASPFVCAGLSRPIALFTASRQQFWGRSMGGMKPADVLVTSPSHLSRLDAMAALCRPSAGQARHPVRRRAACLSRRPVRPAIVLGCRCA